MPAEPARDVGEDRVPVLKLDREGRARKNLLYRAENFKGRLFRGLGCGTAVPGRERAAGYDKLFL